MNKWVRKLPEQQPLSVARRWLLVVATLVSMASCSGNSTNTGAVFLSDFSSTVDRAWIGSDYYANRLQDWLIRNGRVEAIEARTIKPMRTLQLLTYALDSAEGTLEMSVRTGPASGSRANDESTWSGFLIGAGGNDVDFRITALVHHWPGEDGGLIVALDGTGRVVVRDNSLRGAYKGNEAEYKIDDWPLLQPESSRASGELPDEVVLHLTAEPGVDGYELGVRAEAPDGTMVSEARYRNVDPQFLTGNVALVSHLAPNETERGYWFDDWSVSGTKLKHHPDRAFGPVVGVQYTLSDQVLKLTAQMTPLGAGDIQTGKLQIQKGAEWITVAESRLMTGSYTIPFRVEGWSQPQNVRFRVAYRSGNDVDTYFYDGTIRSPDTVSDEFVLAVLNCNNISSGEDLQWNRSTIWHPHEDLLAAVQSHDPDMVFFAGDQFYEKGLEGIERSPIEVAYLDHLYHWYRFMWAFGELTRNMPSVAIPDDHDVYHGNIWGEAGKPAIGPYELQHDNGGYIMPADWVNAVHRTQTSHLPDPVDPTPIKQGISVFYTDLKYAGLSFAIIADRMWKSAPRPLLPEAKIWNGWIGNPEFDPLDTDIQDATLLGERQLGFLDQWTEDWSSGTWMKVLLSATPFNNVATLPQHAMNDAVVPDLVYPQAGEYVDGDKSVADLDSNGWPQTGRNRALTTIRKGYAFHVAGDQHLSSFIHYGVDEWRDSGFAFVSPAIANFWPRRWFPPVPGENREPGSPANTGDHVDGFGNKLSVHAVANPVRSGREPAALYDRSPGYGIVRFRRGDRSITAEAWPRWVDPTTDGASQYPGWPVTVTQEQNYGRAAAGYLPTLTVSGLDSAVVRLVDEATDETVYTIRIQGTTFRPKVFELSTTYSVYIGDPDAGNVKVFSGLLPAKENDEVLSVVFEI